MSGRPRGYKCIACDRKITVSGSREVEQVALPPAKRLPHRYAWRICHSCRLTPAKRRADKDRTAVGVCSDTSPVIPHSPRWTSRPSTPTSPLPSLAVIDTVSSSASSGSSIVDEPPFSHEHGNLAAHMLEDSVEPLSTFAPNPVTSSLLGPDTTLAGDITGQLSDRAPELQQGQLVAHTASPLLCCKTSHQFATTEPPLAAEARQLTGLHAPEKDVLEAIELVEDAMPPTVMAPSSSTGDWSNSALSLPLMSPAISASALLAVSRLAHSTQAASSLASQSTEYQQRLRVLARQLEEMATAIEPSGEGADDWSSSMSRFDRLHPDTKSLEAMYREYRKRCDLVAGADKDTSNLPEKRARRPPSLAPSLVQPTHCIPDTVSPGYGECTRAAFDNVCQYLCDELPAPLRMGPDSVFLDIGSGYGKCVVHARFRAGVRKSIGIEYMSKRHELAIEMLRHHLPRQFPSMRSRLRPESTIELLEGDATSDEFDDAFRSATHVFMFRTRPQRL